MRTLGSTETTERMRILGSTETTERMTQTIRLKEMKNS